MVANVAAPRRRQAGSGRRRLLFGVGIVGFIVLAGVGLMFFLRSRPTAPLPKMMASSGHGITLPDKPIQASMGNLPKTEPRAQPNTRVSLPRFLGDPVLAGGMNPVNVDGTIAYPVRGASANGTGAPNEEAEGFKPDLGPTSIAHVDNNYLYKLYAGAHVPCDTRDLVNTQLPGDITCVIPEDIRNSKQNLVLIPKGSHVFGHLRADLKPFQDRVPVIWARIDTSDTPTILVPLNTGTADPMGTPGMPVTVNDHFWSVALATAVYTLIEWGPALGVAALQSGQNSVNSFNFNTYGLTQPGESLAGKVLKKYIDQPPTGEASLKRITIVFGHDVDFSKSIHVRMARSYAN